MGLRNLDIDSTVRAICQNPADSFDNLVALCNAKLKECGLKADAGKAVAKAPKHAGRKNPLAGQYKGSADLNVRAIVDWVESITPLSPLADDADAATKQAHAEMQAAHENLLIVQASLTAK